MAIVVTHHTAHMARVRCEAGNKCLSCTAKQESPTPLVPHVIGDQGDVGAHIIDPALHHPTKKVFRSDQALLDTAALSGSTFASLALAPLSRLLFVGAGQDGNAKNAPRGEITKNPNDE